MPTSISIINNCTPKKIKVEGGGGGQAVILIKTAVRRGCSFITDDYGDKNVKFLIN